MQCWLCLAFESDEPESFQLHVNSCDGGPLARDLSPLWAVFAPRLHDASATTARGNASGDVEAWPVPPLAHADRTHSTRAVVVRGAFSYTLGPLPDAGTLDAADANLVWQGEVAAAGERRRTIYLGSEAAARSAAWLAEAGITAVVNCAYNSEPLPPDARARVGVTSYARLDLVDAVHQRAGQDARALIRAGADVVAAAFASGHRAVLVHCVAGMSRSASVVLAYLIRRGGEGAPPGLSLADAALAVKARRPVAYPNRSFWAALRALEVEERGGDSSVPLEALEAWHRGEDRFPISTHIFGDAARS